ncbi:MAG: hypothetical protein O7I42_23435, partial [Alphaproteobacteria bacterium]|nr:hypothetical protein [Alphaproteobacteria bacterium]
MAFRITLDTGYAHIEGGSYAQGGKRKRTGPDHHDTPAFVECCSLLLAQRTVGLLLFVELQTRPAFDRLQ